MAASNPLGLILATAVALLRDDAQMTVDVLGAGRHPDLPQTFVHFTGRPRAVDDEPPAFASGSARDRLVQVLFEGRLRAASSFLSPPVVCISEATDAALTTMLKTGVSDRGTYAPWAVLLSRETAIQRGARPALYVSPQERTRWRLGLEPKPQDELTEGRFVTYAPPRVDWTHEREWRFCFNRSAADPAVDLAGLVVGVITGSRDWYPHPITTPLGGLTHRKYAGSCESLPRFRWTGDELLLDGTFDIRGQMMLGPD